MLHHFPIMFAQKITTTTATGQLANNNKKCVRQKVEEKEVKEERRNRKGNKVSLELAWGMSSIFMRGLDRVQAVSVWGKGAGEGRLVVGVAGS